MRGPQIFSGGEGMAGVGVAGRPGKSRGAGAPARGGGVRLKRVAGGSGGSFFGGD